MALEWFELLKWAMAITVPPISALCGIWVGARLTDRREAEKRRYDFIEQQLSEFYAPLLGIRREILVRNELRVRISGFADTAWRELCARHGGGDPEVLRRLMDERSPKFSAIIDHDNKHLREAALPAYRKMVEIFRDKLWLAESDAQEFFPVLIEFIDIWDRFVADSLPHEVLIKLNHSEASLHPFYDNLQITHDRLRGILVLGASAKN